VEYDLLGRPILTPAQKRAEKRAEKAAYAKGLACYEHIQALLQAGDLTGAVRAITPFQAAEYYDQAIKAVAMAQVQAGELLAAVATAQRSRHYKDEVVDSVIQVLLQRGDVAGAEWLAATVTGFALVGMMQRIAEAQHQAGSVEAARHTLTRARESAENFYEGDMKNGYPRSYYLSDLVKAQLRLDDVAGATHTAQLIDRAEYQSPAFRAIEEHTADAADNARREADLS